MNPISFCSTEQEPSSLPQPKHRMQRREGDGHRQIYVETDYAA